MSVTSVYTEADMTVLTVRDVYVEGDMTVMTSIYIEAHECN
jgi:hypothetical protein